jgi:hypothetical protein
MVCLLNRPPPGEKNYGKKNGESARKEETRILYKWKNNERFAKIGGRSTL